MTVIRPLPAPRDREHVVFSGRRSEPVDLAVGPRTSQVGPPDLALGLWVIGCHCYGLECFRKGADVKVVDTFLRSGFSRFAERVRGLLVLCCDVFAAAGRIRNISGAGAGLVDSISFD